ncbi:MAG: YfiR family protein [Pseudomonadota bacterium]
MAALKRAIFFLALGFYANFVFGAGALSEAQVKVAFVYNFAKFTTWPSTAFSTPQSPLILCLIRTNDNAAAVFSAIEGKQAQGRTLQIKRSVRSEDLKACHILYVGDADEKSTIETLRTLGEAPVLTIADTEGFIHFGGIIELVAADSNIQFEVNLDAARHANISFSAQLLKLSKVVLDSQAKGRHQ